MPEKAAGPFESGMKLLSSSIDEARRLIGGLHRRSSTSSGSWRPSNTWSTIATRGAVPRCRSTTTSRSTVLRPRWKPRLFRIVQEALTNVNRHSGSAKASIGLSQAGDRIHVNVRDWGVGFDPARVQEGRFGLQGIRERVRLLGGRAVITTAPGQGTQIFVEFPLIEAPAAVDRL